MGGLTLPSRTDHGWALMYFFLFLTKDLLMTHVPYTLKSETSIEPF